MTKNELFAKYHISGDHKVWQPEIDNWISNEAVFNTIYYALKAARSTIKRGYGVTIEPVNE